MSNQQPKFQTESEDILDPIEHDGDWGPETLDKDDADEKNWERSYKKGSAEPTCVSTNEIIRGVLQNRFAKK